MMGECKAAHKATWQPPWRHMHWWRVVLAGLLAFLAADVFARESCPFFRDPAFYARASLPPAAAGEFTVGTLNVYRLFDDEQDQHEKDVLTPAEFSARITRIARYIAKDMGAPAVIALQEIEDDTSLKALANALQHETGRPWQWLLGEASVGSDIRTGLLLDARLSVLQQKSLFAAQPYERGPRFDRLPQWVDIDGGGAWPNLGTLRLVVVHLKSQSGMDSKKDGVRVREKRLWQAQRLADWAHEQVQAGAPPLLVLGDFNAPAQDPDVVRSEPMQRLLKNGALIDTAERFLTPGQRWTYRYRCSLQQLDHVLVSPALAPQVRGYGIVRGDTCLRTREKCDSQHSVSDHDGVVLRLKAAVK